MEQEQVKKFLSDNLKWTKDDDSREQAGPLARIFTICILIILILMMPIFVTLIWVGALLRVLISRVWTSIKSCFQ